MSFSASQRDMPKELAMYYDAPFVQSMLPSVFIDEIYPINFLKCC
jgi:hypothetical protein